MLIGVILFVAALAAGYFLFIRGKKTQTVEQEGAELLAKAKAEGAKIDSVIKTETTKVETEVKKIV